VFEYMWFFINQIILCALKSDHPWLLCCR